MKVHASVRSMAGLLARVAAAAMAIGCSEAGTGDGDSIVEQSGALSVPASNDWAQFQHDAVHSGDNPIEAAFTSARLRKPLQIAFKAHYPATGFQIVGNDAGVFAFKLGGCGAGQTLCPPLSLTQVGLNQFNLNAPLAIARNAVYYTSTDNDDGHSNVYALKLP